MAAATLLIVAGGLLVIFGGGYWLLRIFNQDYTSYYGALVVLSLGTAAVAAVGPSAPILMLTGHEGRCLSIIGATVLMRSVGFFILIPLFGIYGAVAATAVSFIWMAVMLRNSAVSLVGVDASLLRLWRRRVGPRISLPAE